MDGLEREFAGRVNIVQLNAAEPGNAERLQAYGLRGHPSAVVLDSESVVRERFFGPQPADILRQALSAVLAAGSASS